MRMCVCVGWGGGIIVVVCVYERVCVCVCARVRAHSSLFIKQYIFSTMTFIRDIHIQEYRYRKTSKSLFQLQQFAKPPRHASRH